MRFFCYNNVRTLKVGFNIIFVNCNESETPKLV